MKFSSLPPWKEYMPKSHFIFHKLLSNQGWTTEPCTATVVWWVMKRMVPAFLLSCFLACRRHHSWPHFVSPRNATWKCRNHCLSQSGLSAVHCLPKSFPSNFPWLTHSKSIFICHRAFLLTCCLSKPEVSASLAVQAAGTRSPAAFLLTYLGGVSWGAQLKPIRLLVRSTSLWKLWFSDATHPVGWLDWRMLSKGRYVSCQSRFLEASQKLPAHAFIPALPWKCLSKLPVCSSRCKRKFCHCLGEEKWNKKCQHISTIPFTRNNSGPLKGQALEVQLSSSWRGICFCSGLHLSCHCHNFLTKVLLYFYYSLIGNAKSPSWIAPPWHRVIH